MAGRLYFKDPARRENLHLDRSDPFRWRKPSGLRSFVLLIIDGFIGGADAIRITKEPALSIPGCPHLIRKLLSKRLPRQGRQTPRVVFTGHTAKDLNPATEAMWQALPRKGRDQAVNTYLQGVVGGDRRQQIVACLRAAKGVEVYTLPFSSFFWFQCCFN